MSMREEIHEQPAVLRRLLREGRGAAEETAALLRQKDAHWIYLAARGSSDHAATYAKYALGIRNRIPISLAAPSIFSLYGTALDLQHAVVLAISQSGASPDILSVVTGALAQGRPAAAITNTRSSPLASQASTVLDILAGEERSVAATKTYTAELMAVAMLSAALSGEESAWNELREVPGWIDTVLAREDRVQLAAEAFVGMDRCMVLGRGFNLPTAYEWSLKMKELSGVFAEPYSTADFLHGPMAAVNADTPVLGVAPAGMVYEDVVGVLRQLAAERQTPLLIISNREEALKLSRIPLSFPEATPEWLSPIVGVVAAQLFCYWITVRKGLDPERPVGLSKVTRTT
jgi:glucosamine--fructose-6-phosphate aminotransferase (isomerizing)